MTQTMIMTYDNEANASYLYFTRIGPGGVDRTITNQRVDVGLDDNDQIINVKVYESKECQFQNRLKHALQYPEAKYEAENCLVVSFADTGVEKKIIAWDANIDLDKSGQILGVEILFADPDDPDDGKQLHAEGKLAHMSKYIVPFDSLH